MPIKAVVTARKLFPLSPYADAGRPNPPTQIFNPLFLFTKQQVSTASSSSSAHNKKIPSNSDSAFTSPTPFTTASKPAAAAVASAAGWDSAFGSSADNTPTHNPSANAKLEFADDPFKDSNYRYGDPFDIAAAAGDPFQDKEDPFTAPVAAAFGTELSAGAAATTATTTPSAEPAPLSGLGGGDPFSLTTLASSSAPKDPFSSPSASSASNDPFAAAAFSQSSSSSSAQKGSDPFGSDPFSPFASGGGGGPQSSSWNKATPNKSTQDDWFNAANAGRPPRVDGVARYKVICYSYCARV